jgi:hypothetical protein
VRRPFRLAPVFVVLVLCLCATSVAAAGSSIQGGSILQRGEGDGGHHGKRGEIVPAGFSRGGLLLRDWWEGPLSVPADHPANPFNADGCIVRGGVALFYGGECTVPRGTPVFRVAVSTECSNVEEPPFHAATPREALLCGLLGDQFVTAATLTLDDGPPVDLLDGRFDAFMPWSQVVIPQNPIFGGTPGEIMRYGGHGYVALVRSLSVGTHTLLLHMEGQDEPGFDFPIDAESTIIVTR